MKDIVTSLMSLIKFRRDRTRSQSSSSANNRIHISDDSDSQDSSPQTPTAILPQSNSKSSASSANQHIQQTRASPQLQTSSVNLNQAFPSGLNLQDTLENPFFGSHGTDFMDTDQIPSPPYKDLHDPGPSNVNHHGYDPPPNPLAQQSQVVRKIDVIPSNLHCFLAAIFWHNVSRHFQYYDIFFTALHTLATSWSKIPFQKGWLLQDATWRASLPNNSSCLGMMVVNMHD